jgi:spore coat polysaccharide biosynthesis protein SpsF
MSGGMILAILQARMSSSRLPGKVLKPLAGRPMVLRQIERLARARRLDDLVLATSTEASDDPLAEAMAAEGVAVHRGPLNDVLARFIGALDAHPADHVVRLTADCPLADPEGVDATIDLHLASAADYTSNTAETFAFPKGLDVEVVAAPALRRAAAEAATPEEHEHVTWGLYNGDHGYRTAWLSSANADDGDIRWTVDTPDDYAFAAAVYDALYPANPAFTSADIRAFLATRPDLAQFGGHRRL